MIRSKASFTQVQVYGVGLRLSPEVCAFVLLLAIKVLAKETPCSAKDFARKDYMPSAFLENKDCLGLFVMKPAVKIN